MTYQETEIATGIARLTKDMREAAKTLTDAEARYLVDAYYIMQGNRIRADNQLRAIAELNEPASVLGFIGGQFDTLETRVKQALDIYSANHPAGAWARKQVGIGPVIAAGLVAHIDIGKCPTASNVWRFAGLDPTVKWEKKTRRPWNAQLKTLCWKLGESFVKVSGNADAFYGGVYKERKALEIERNEAGKFAAQAAAALENRNWDKTTDAYKHYIAGKLPPAHIHRRACRYTVKLFLSHLHEVWYRLEFGKDPPKPFAIAMLDHGHYIAPPE